MGESTVPRVYPTVGEIVRTWPWIIAAVAAIVVNLIVGGFRHFDYGGINGFSTTNYGWLALTLVGGIVFAWRLAGRPQAPIGILRPLLPAALSYVLCFILVMISGLVFLPEQPAPVTAATDAPGRALPIAVAVLAVSVVLEGVRTLLRARQSRNTRAAAMSASRYSGKER